MSPTQTTVQSSDDGFLDTYGASIVVVFGGLVVFHLPIVSMINWVPTVKEVILGVVVVAGFTSTTDPGQALKFALVSGMVAAVAFNLVYVPVATVLGGLWFAATSGAESAVTMGLLGGLLAGFGALLNLVGLVLFSPVGYGLGGLIGTVFNE